MNESSGSSGGGGGGSLPFSPLPSHPPPIPSLDAECDDLEEVRDVMHTPQARQEAAPTKSSRGRGSTSTHPKQRLTADRHTSSASASPARGKEGEEINIAAPVLLPSPFTSTDMHLLYTAGRSSSASTLSAQPSASPAPVAAYAPSAPSKPNTPASDQIELSVRSMGRRRSSAGSRNQVADVPDVAVLPAGSHSTSPASRTSSIAAAAQVPTPLLHNRPSPHASDLALGDAATSTPSTHTHSDASHSPVVRVHMDVASEVTRSPRARARPAPLQAQSSPSLSATGANLNPPGFTLGDRTPSVRGSRFLTRTHVSFSGVPLAEEKIELSQQGPRSTGSKGSSNRTPKLLKGSSSSQLKEKIRLRSYTINDTPSILAQNFPSNFIKTSKYTLLTFLPVNLFEQFRRLANAYFLFVVLIQTIPGVSPFPIFTSLAPLIFILAVGALNEAREDFYRHRADAVANSRPCVLLQPGGKTKDITSAVVQVGQILKITNNQEFPADLILLHTSREDGTCYVNTANLDGEAAPKMRSASGATQSTYNTAEKLTEDLRARIQYEEPNASLYRFQGNVLLPDPATGTQVLHPLGDKQLLLRGSKLVNTDFVYGLVVYTGYQTKMMLNRNPAQFKFSHFEGMLNRCVIVCLLLNLLVCLIPSLFYVFTDLSFAKYWGIDESDGLGWLLGFISLYILFSFMVPQSLYVTIELVKVGQAYFMEWDRELAWTDPDTGEFTRCAVKSSALNEELGVVDVICTDKTGTLTSNQMELSRCSVGGRLFFENESHRTTHQHSFPQPDAHRKVYGPHALMTQLAEVGFSGWIVGRDREGQVIFDQGHDWMPMPTLSMEEEDVERENPSPKMAATPASATSASSSSTNQMAPSPSYVARDFLLNILVCNAVLPSWKEAPELLKGEAKPTVEPVKVHGLEDSSPLVQKEAPAGQVSLQVNEEDASSPSPSSSSDDDEHVGEKLVFESQSPDEIALLQALHRIGVTLNQRSGNNLQIDIKLPKAEPMSSVAASSLASVASSFMPPVAEGAEGLSVDPLSLGSAKVRLQYTVLAQLEFASAWRRNSVIVRGPDGIIKLYSKGADSTIAELVDKEDPYQQHQLALVMAQATIFAGTGSRTLVFAGKTLSQREFDEWYPIYDAAQNAFNDRDKQIERSFSLIEKGMHILGCSAVDDQLQELVPQTVDFLIAAKVKIIVLTGDHRSTAVQIAKESHLIRPNVHILYLEGVSSRQVGVSLTKIIQQIEQLQEAARANPHGKPVLASQRSRSSLGGANATPRSKDSAMVPSEAPLTEQPPVGFALAVDGVALETALLYHRPLFMQVFAVLDTVVSYRSTPMQKALVVKLMKETGKTCLAIGDGANDVSMIQESHVGIGILGKEGAHAAMSSDFVIKRFNHLRRLICVHGRHNYWRTTQVVMFSFYKNLAFPLPLFWYCFYSMANGTTAYDPLLITAFNTFFTSLPPFFVGIFDKDVDEATLMQSPAAFHAFKKQSPFTVSSFIYALVTGAYQSCVFYFLAHFMFLGNDVIRGMGHAEGMAVMGNMIMSSVVLTTNLTMLAAHSAINWVSIASVAIGLLLFMGVFLFEAVSYQEDFAPEGYGMGEPIFGSAAAWFYIILSCILCLMPNAIYEAWMKLYYPAVYQQLQHVPAEIVEQKEAAEKAEAQAQASSHGTQAEEAAHLKLPPIGNQSPRRQPASSPKAPADIEMTQQFRAVQPPQISMPTADQ